MYRCAHPECPGYDWPASARIHPPETCNDEGIRRALQQRAEALQERVDEWRTWAIGQHVARGPRDTAVQASISDDQLRGAMESTVSAVVSAALSPAAEAELRQRLASARVSLQKLQDECAGHRAREWEAALRCVAGPNWRWSTPAAGDPLELYVIGGDAIVSTAARARSNEKLQRWRNEWPGLARLVDTRNHQEGLE